MCQRQKQHISDLNKVNDFILFILKFHFRLAFLVPKSTQNYILKQKPRRFPWQFGG